MDICAYVMDAYAKQTYATESHDVRAWPGFEVVLDAARRAGFEYKYAGRATVHEYDVVLISITSDCDWWPLLSEIATWRRRPLVIAGGAGVMNVRPFLRWVDCFVLGRGEELLPAILEAHKDGGRFESESVIWSDSFSMETVYKIAQVDAPYPYTVTMTNGKPFTERSVGCPNKCLFCGYTWQRKYYGDGGFAAGADSMAQGNRERTIIELLKIDPKHWQDEAPLRIVGLDGMSERLRMQANKRITRKMFREFLRGLSVIEKPHQVKLYCIVGYPNETREDWHEFTDDIKIVSDSCGKKEKQWSLLSHFTPFRAMPSTPSATWPMSYQNYRGKIARELKDPRMKGNVFYQDNGFWVVEGMGTESLPTVIQSAICHRGTESDADNVMTIARARRYWSANSISKQATLEKMFDVATLFGAFTWENLPTRNILGYVEQRKVEKMGLLAT